MNLEQCICDAISKVASRKNGAALVGIAILYMMQAPAEFILYLAGLAILLQFLLDIIEVVRTGRDLADSGATPAEKPPIVTLTNDDTLIKPNKTTLIGDLKPTETYDILGHFVGAASAPEVTKEAQVG